MRSPLFYFLCPLPASPASFTVSSAGTHLQRISTTRVISIDNLTSNIGNIIHMSHWSRRTTMLLTSGIAAVSVALAAPAIALLPGSDVASHQHPGGTPINWQRVRLSGYTFTIIKATEGTGYTNPYFKQDRAGSHSVGMIVGSYHYARPNQNPITQALHYADTIDCQKRPMELPPVLDLEETGGLPPLLLQGWTAAFLTTLNLHCATNTVVYTYPYFWRTAMQNTPIFSFAPLWLADYNNHANPTEPLPGGWANWNIWQYTSRGSVPGIPAVVDLNKFNGSLAGLAAFSLRQQAVPTVPAVNVKGQWKVDPSYLEKALKQAKKGLRVAPIYQTPMGATPMANYQATSR